MDNDKIFQLLQQLLGISQHTTEQMIDTLSVSGELPQAIEAVSALYDEIAPESDDEFNKANDGVIDSPTDPDNSDNQRYYDVRDTSGWDPEQDRARADAEQEYVDAGIDPDLYSPKSRKQPMAERQSFVTFLEQRVNSDATIVDLADEVESELDDATKRKIAMYQRNNNPDMADKVRNQAIEKIKRTQPSKPQTPAERRVEHHKKQLNKAVHLAKKQQDAK